MARLTPAAGYDSKPALSRPTRVSTRVHQSAGYDDADDGANQLGRPALRRPRHDKETASRDEPYDDHEAYELRTVIHPASVGVRDASLDLDHSLDPGSDLDGFEHYGSDVDHDLERYGSDEGERYLDNRHARRHRTMARDGRRESYTLYTPDEERRVRRKLDRHLVLFVALLYLLSFLDRSNIGNARIADMQTDLHLNSDQYEWLLTAFYITYILFEWMTLLYRVIRPHVYIALCVASWGLIASVQCLASSFGSMLFLRALLGIGEAAFGPGVPFYLSFFYRREELALRTGLFISAAPLATTFASSLAWLITYLGRNLPIAPWRLLFLVEGFPSMLVAVVAWHHLPDSPGSARFLNARERRVAKLRVRAHRQSHGMSKRRRESQDHHGSGLRWAEVGQTLCDPKCYLTALMFLCCNVAFSSLPPFLPTIIREMQYSALESQALSVPPYLLAFLTILGTAIWSDRTRSRSLFICIQALLGAAGYSIVALAGFYRTGPVWRYIGVCLGAMGFFSAVTLIITWTLNNQPSTSRQGTGMAVLNVVGQCGPLVGVRLFPDRDAPYFVPGMSACAAFMLAVAILALVLRCVLSRKNGRIYARQAAERAMGFEMQETRHEEPEDHDARSEDQHLNEGSSTVWKDVEREDARAPADAEDFIYML